MKLPTILANARVLVHLKHIAAELKRGNDIAEYRLRMDHPGYRKLELKPHTPKLAELDVPTVEELNKAYEDAIEAGLETRLEDE